jgi:hypothetical protein
MVCTRCNGSGFLNAERIPTDVWKCGVEAILSWLAEATEPHDVMVCDCCGNAEQWYGEPGEHYGPDDPAGNNGPYSYNGGLCECH